MAELNYTITCDFDNIERGANSTDMGKHVLCGILYLRRCANTVVGNVTYECPGMHSTFRIPAEAGSSNHTPGFTTAAGTKEALNKAIQHGKGMAVAGWRILQEDDIAAQVRHDFEEDLLICQLKRS